MMLLTLALAVFAAQDNIPAFEVHEWKLTELNGAKLPEGVKIIPTMQFIKGRVSGNAGCNRFFASYKADGDLLKIEKIGSTMMACAPPVVEQPFLKALGATERYRVVKDELELLGKDGKVIARFAPK